MISNLKVELLSDREKEQILDAAYSLLEDPGVNIYSEKAVELLTANGCTADGIRVRIPRELVKKCINRSEEHTSELNSLMRIAYDLY